MKIRNIKSLGKYEFGGYMIREIKTGEVGNKTVFFYLESNGRVFIPTESFLGQDWKKY